MVNVLKMNVILVIKGPGLRLKSSESVMKQTVANARKDILSQYFELLEQILIKNNSKNLIFNCDFMLTCHQ